MKNRTKNEFLLLKLLYFARYFGSGLFISFFSLYLHSTGLSTNMMGRVFSIQTVFVLCAYPLYSIICRNANINRLVLKATIVLEGLFVLLFHITDKYFYIVICTALLAIVSGPTGNIMDGFSKTFSKINNRNYQIIRFYGSLSYFIATMISGLIIHYFSFQVMFIFAGMIYILSSSFIYFIKPLDLETIDVVKSKHALRSALRNPKIYIYLIITILLATTNASIANYNSVFLTTNYQLTTSNYGYLSAFVILFESLFIFWGRKIIKINHAIYAIILASFFNVMKYFIFSFNPPLAIAIMMFMFQGIASGLSIGFNIECITNILGLENVTFGVFIITIGSSLAKVGIDLAVGSILEKTTYLSFYRSYSLGLFVIIFICGLLLAIFEKLNIFSLNEKSI